MSNSGESGELRLVSAVADEMITHAIEGEPLEACGLFSTGGDADATSSDEVAVFYPMTNIRESRIVYELDGQEMLDVEADADKQGRRIVGVMHSHTHTPAYPSPTDVADATRFDPFGAFHYIIVSLENDGPVLRDFRIVNGRITEQAVLLV